MQEITWIDRLQAVQQFVVIRFLGPVLVALFLSIVAGYIYVYIYTLLPYYTVESTVGLCFHVGLFLLLSLNTLYNYAKCVTVRPGTTNKIADSQHYADISFHICSKCQQPKPPRAHHCRLCNICVLKMDHHCPWINNCVGHFNHVYFMLFIAYAWLACLYFMAMLWRPFWETHTLRKISLLDVDNDNMLLCFVVGGALTVVMSGFLLWNVYLVCTAQTSIEVAINKSGEAEWDAHPYDLGAAKNLRIFFNIPKGETLPWLQLLIPQKRYPYGDGIKWTYRKDVLLTTESGEIINMGGSELFSVDTL